MKKKIIKRNTGRRAAAAAPAMRLSWGYLLLTIFCACLLAAGFFFAGLQHFATMDLGFKNSELRKVVDELEAEKRRLILAREVSLSPAEIMKTARSMGFREAADEPMPAAVETAQRPEEPRREIAAADVRSEAESSPAARRQPDAVETQRPRTVAERTAAEKRPAPPVVSAIVSTRATSEPKEAKANAAPRPAEVKPAAAPTDSRPRRVASDTSRRPVNTAELR